MNEKIEKIVIAYSGGLDTSVIVKWLKQEYQCQIIAYTADIGQVVDKDMVERNALQHGAEKFYFENLQEQFARDYIFPMFRANALYEGLYLLGTAIARPLIAKRQVEIAHQNNADAVSHGATGKGNDQIRFELSYYAMDPNIKVIAPWRQWQLDSRKKLIDFANKHQISIPKDKRGEAPFSVDQNLLHTSSEGKMLEDPAKEPPDYVYQKILSPEQATDKIEQVTMQFYKGDPVAVNGEQLSPAKLMEKLNELGCKHAIGRIDIVENRFVGMKSRGVYETPGGTILARVRRAIESITLDKGAAHLKDELMPKYAEMIYNGFWFSPERKMLQAAIDLAAQPVSGLVRFKLYKGNIIICGIESAMSLYSDALVTFEDDEVYDHKDADGFIKLNALRLRLLRAREDKNDDNDD